MPAAQAVSSSLDIWEIIKIGLGAGVISTGLTLSVSSYRDKAANTRIANYSALRLAVELEAFSIACADAIADANMYISSEGHAGTQHIKVPVLQAFPDDVDWKLLDSSISAKISTFRNELTLAHQVIVFWYEIDSECVPNECLNQLGLCGYRAWAMAAELRDIHKIPCFDPKRLSWDVEECLKNQYNSAITELKKKE